MTEIHTSPCGAEGARVRVTVEYLDEDFQGTLSFEGYQSAASFGSKRTVDTMPIGIHAEPMITHEDLAVRLNITVHGASGQLTGRCI